MFYVISGVSFGYVYRHMSVQIHSLKGFWIKRYFRLAPLYCLVLAVRSVEMFASTGHFPGLAGLAVNATLTFGVVSPSSYMVVGGWSIGNEMFYYVLFPFAVLALRRSVGVFSLLLTAVVAIGAAYAYWLLSSTRPLSMQWNTYIQPASHLFYFISGVAFSAPLAAGHRINARKGVAGTALLVSAYLGLAASDGVSDNIVAVTGWRWAAYSALAIGIVGIVSWVPGKLPRGLHSPLSWLGGVSYSVYLLHPLTWEVSGWLTPRLGGHLERAIVAGALCLLAAHYVHRALEAPMVRVGRRLAGTFEEVASSTARNEPKRVG